MNEDQQYSIERLRLGAVIAVALAIAFLAWLIFVRNGDDETTPGGQPAVQVGPFGPEIVDRAGLRDAAADLGHEIYWAGPDEPGRVELTTNRNGQAFVRYLTGGAEPGRAGGGPDFLTVATYPIGDAFAATTEVAGRQGRESFEIDAGGIAVFSTGNPERVYFAYPDSELQVEVFDPSPGRARDLVEANRIVPIG